MRAPVIALVLISLLAVPTARAQENDDLLVLGQLFCDLRKGGVEQPVRYLLTKAMLEAIDAAEVVSAAAEAAHPDDKPPLGDGIPFQSFPDVADTCQPSDHGVSGQDAWIAISYTFTLSPDANYTDRVVVKSENGRRLIDDVLYGSDKYGSSLRQALAAIAKTK